jgi:hypothetical protein
MNEELIMNKTIASVLITVPVLLFLALPAAADRRDGRDGGWHGDRGHFQRSDMDHWRRDGRWRHGWHEGRVGWWWVVGGLWYFYPSPVYPYPDFYAPPVVVEQQPPIVVQQQPPVVVQQAPAPTAPPAIQVAPPQPAQNWYYCEPSKAYYPYVNSCATGWKVVPASPPGAPQ